MSVYTHGVICIIQNHNLMAVFAVRDMTPVSACFRGKGMRYSPVYRFPTSDLDRTARFPQKNPICYGNTTCYVCEREERL